LDTISAGCTIAFAIECYENGLITKDDTDGIELNWGNAEAIVAMTQKMADRDGFGDVLADGAKIASDKIGEASKEYAVHIGGQEVPMHDAKFTPGLGPTYLLDATPARHTQGGELIGPGEGIDLPEIDRTVYTGRAESQRTLVNLMHVVNASGICMFGYLSMDCHSIPEFISAVTGWECTLEDLQDLGERIGTIRHAFNLREGHNPLNREVAGRAIGIPALKRGPLKGLTVDMDTLIKEFLELIEWDPETTVPSKKRLLELGLDDVAADLHP
jgi:aldehyde:ferredoxin oxidoreductase